MYIRKSAYSPREPKIGAFLKFYDRRLEQDMASEEPLEESEGCRRGTGKFRKRIFF